MLAFVVTKSHCWVMLDLAQQDPQLLFCRAAPTQSVPRLCCCMGYSITEASLAFVFVEVEWDLSIQSSNCWGPSVRQPFPPSVQLFSPTLSDLSYPIYLAHYKKQCCHKTFLSYYPLLAHLTWFLTFTLLTTYHRFWVGISTWKLRGRQGGWWFGPNT